VRWRPGFVATAGLLVFGALAAGFAGNLPELLRAALALVVVLALPAMLLARHLPGFARIDAPALRATVVFLAWLSMLALWSAAFTLLRAPFHLFATATMWLFFALYAGAALVPSMRRVRPAPLGRAPRALWIAVAACALFAAVIPQRLTVSDDSLDHVGYVRHILSEDSLQPAGVLALPVDAGATTLPPDPRKGALHPVMAFSTALATAEPANVWRWLPAFMFPVAVLALCAFNAAFLPSRAARIAVAALILLSFHGNPFRFAGASAHGESLAALWCWVMTAAAVSDARAQVRPLMWMLLAAGGVLVHLGVAAHAVVLVATVACLGGAWGMSALERIRVAASVLAGTVFAVALRAGDIGGTVNPIHGHTQGVLFVAKQWFVASPMEILRLDGMLFLGGLACIPLLAFAARSRPDARAVLAAAAIPLLVSFVPWVATPLFHRGSYMVFRSLLNVPAYAAIVVCAWWLGTSWRSHRSVALLIGVPAAALWLVIFARPLPRSLTAELRAQARARVPDARTELAPPLERMVAALPASSVILSDPATSYALSAVTSQRFVAVYQQHANPRDPFALERLKAVRDVLSPYVTADVAQAACRRFGVNYVVVNGSPPPDASGFLPLWSRARYPVALARMGTMNQAFARVDSVGGAVIYRFEPAAPASWSWSAQDQPVRVGSPVLSPCSVAAPGGDFTVTGVSVSPARALPGDTVQVTIGYRHDAPSPFALPALLYVRFDHETLDRGREYPGEKIARRLRDGRAGVRSRFRADFIPGHGVYEPDLWPTGFDLCETFVVVIPANARLGRYDVRLAVADNALVPNFHLRDLLYNRDHYSGRTCASLVVAGSTTGGAGS